MSRPYLKINSMSYATVSNVLSVDLTALRIRGNGDISLSGSLFVKPATISLVDGYANGTYTYSVNIDGSTASGGTFVPATATFVIAGSYLPGDNVSIELGALGKVLGASGFTFSGTSSITSDWIVRHLASNFVAPVTGFSATSDFGSGLVPGGNTLTISAPYGSYYNELDAVLTSTASTFTASATFSEFSGGETLHSMNINAPSYFNFSESASFNLTTGDVYITGEGA